VLLDHRHRHAQQPGHVGGTQGGGVQRFVAILPVNVHQKSFGNLASGT